MADGVYAVDRLLGDLRVPDVAGQQAGIGGPVVRPPVVHGRGQAVQAADVVAGGQRRVRDVRTDEPGRAGDEDAHAGTEPRRPAPAR